MCYQTFINSNLHRKSPHYIGLNSFTNITKTKYVLELNSILKQSHFKQLATEQQTTKSNATVDIRRLRDMRLQKV